MSVCAERSEGREVWPLSFCFLLFLFFVFFGSWVFVSLTAEGSLCYDRTQIFAFVSVGDIFGALINSFVLLILHKRFGPLSASDCSNSPRD